MTKEQESGTDPFSFDLYLQDLTYRNNQPKPPSLSETPPAAPNSHTQLSIDTDPLTYFFGQDELGEYLVPDEAIQTRSSQPVKPEDEPEIPQRNPYKNHPLKPKIKNLTVLNDALELYRYFTVQNQPTKNTAIGLSAIERKLPELYFTLGYNTGTAHLNPEHTTENQERLIQGSLAHTMRVVMQLAFRAYHTHELETMLPTMDHQELDILISAIDLLPVRKPKHQVDCTATMIQAWDNYTHLAKDTRLFTQQQIDLLDSDKIKTWQLLLADHYTTQFLKPNPDPEFEVTATTYFEPTILLKLGGPIGLFVRMQPDQITIKDGLVYVTEFKTSHTLKNLQIKRSMDKIDKKTLQTRRESALRQNQLMLLAAVQLAIQPNLNIYIENGNYRHDPIRLDKRSVTSPNPQPTLVYEMIHTKRQHAIVTRKDLSYLPTQWGEFSQWIELFALGLKLVSKSDRDSAGQDMHATTLMSAMPDLLAQLDPPLALLLNKPDLPD